MTPQETIEYLEKHGYISDDVKDMCIEALEKQIPKKLLDIQEPVVKWGICPTCKGEPFTLGKRTRILESANYCPNCGQALDWCD